MRIVGGTGGGRVDTIGTAATPGAAADSGPVELATSGPYTNGYCHLEASALKPGTYTLVAATFEPDQRASFVLKVFTSQPLVVLSPLPAEGEGMQSANFTGRWDVGAGRNCSPYYLNDV